MSWYKFDGTSKYYLRMMIMRSQKVKYFTGLKIFDCNLTMFKNVSVMV